MKSPYTPKEPVPVRFITEIYLSRLDSRQSQRVIFTEDQFEELQEFLENMFPPETDNEIIRFKVEDEYYEIKKHVL